MLIADSNASTSDDFKYKNARDENSRQDGLQSASRFLGLACVFAYLGVVLLVPILLQAAATPRTVLRAIVTRITLVSCRPSH